MGWPEKNVFVTGSPHYDYFFDSDKNVVGACISEEEFLQKYSLDKTKQKILLMPSNPSSHKEQFEKKGLIFSALSPDGMLPEIIELKNHPWFVGVQFHPEFRSRPFTPHPLFSSFIKAAEKNKVRN